MCKKSIIAAYCALACLFFHAQVTHAAEREPHVLAGIIENDLLYNPAPGEHQDRHYTQGLKVIYLDRGDPVPGWANGLQLARVNTWLPIWGMEPTDTNFGALFGQNIYTPESDTDTNVVTNDRPYAGWLYTGFAIQRRGFVGQIPVLESFELDAGIIGPEAQGEWAQNSVHRFRHLPEFEGWDNQLKTEPGFVLKYGRAWRWTVSEATRDYFDIIPHAGFDLGTVMIAGEFGMTFRVGWHLPDNFGVQTINSPILLTNAKHYSPFSAYLFGRLDDRVVARNVFLDGNLYRDSHSIDKRDFVADMSYGAAMAIGRHIELSWAFVTRTLEFDGQKGMDQFGSLMGKLNWDF